MNILKTKIIKKNSVKVKQIRDDFEFYLDEKKISCFVFLCDYLLLKYEIYCH